MQEREFLRRVERRLMGCRDRLMIGSIREPYSFNPRTKTGQRRVYSSPIEPIRALLGQKIVRRLNCIFNITMYPCSCISSGVLFGHRVSEVRVPNRESQTQDIYLSATAQQESDCRPAAIVANQAETRGRQ
jgi:hypothetical protein